MKKWSTVFNTLSKMKNYKYTNIKNKNIISFQPQNPAPSSPNLKPMTKPSKMVRYLLRHQLFKGFLGSAQQPWWYGSLSVDLCRHCSHPNWGGSPSIIPPKFYTWACTPEEAAHWLEGGDLEVDVSHLYLQGMSHNVYDEKIHCNHTFQSNHAIGYPKEWKFS